MRVSEKVSNDRKSCSEDLTRYVPPALDYSEDHSNREDNTPCRDLNHDVNPENAVLVEQISASPVGFRVLHTIGSAEIALPSSM